MKKLLSLLLTAVMLCSMLVGSTVSAFAAPKADVAVIDITKDADFSNNLKSLGDNQIIVFNLKKDICVDNEIEIKANNCSILIRVDDTYYSKYGDVNIYPRYRTDDDYYRFLNIEGDNVKLYFDGRVICRDFRLFRGSHERGAGICFNGKNGIIANGRFVNCVAGEGGGAIWVADDNVSIKDSAFENCKAPQGPGGAILVYDGFVVGANDCKIYQCSFKGNSCEKTASEDHGDDVCGRESSFKQTDTTIQNCTSDSTNDSHFYSCIVLPDTERTPMDTGADIFGTDFGNDYIKPTMTSYAYTAMQNNKNCDVIRPDIKNVTESENKLFTLEGKNAYGALWEVTYQDALTIKAKDGYTITRIEAVVTNTNDENYNALSIDNGTKGDLIKNDNSLEADSIAHFDDINAKSVTLTTKGNNTNWGTVYFKDFIIYYTQDSTLGSVFSGGTLWIIIGVLVVAAVAAVVIILVKNKKKKLLATNDAVVKKTDEEDD